MDEDLAIINKNTRNEKIKNFFKTNQKKIISLVIFLIIILCTYFFYGEYKNNKKIKLAEFYNSILNNYSDDTKDKSVSSLIEIINQKDSTYSPLSLYYIIDNSLISDINKINELFDILIYETPVEKEIKNLILYKKALYNADKSNENNLLEILNPLIKSNSVWKSQALYLMGEYFYAKNEKQKSKEFFSQLVNLVNGNIELKKEAQKRLQRDLSD